MFFPHGVYIAEPSCLGQFGALSYVRNTFLLMVAEYYSKLIPHLLRYSQCVTEGH